MKRQRRNDVLIKAIAEKLVQLREDRGLSQQIVYIDTELHMGRIERGEYNLNSNRQCNSVEFIVS